MDINEILALPSQMAIGALKDKVISVPDWVQLEQEYNPKKHPVMTDKGYADKVAKGKVEKMTRIVLGWQKLATKRMSELLFGQPCKRIYKPQDEAEKRASEVIEAIFNKNRIDAVNLERAKYLYACCESVTIWYAQQAATTYAGEATPLKLRCKSYSPMNGDHLYPLFDEYDDLIALSVEYIRNEASKKVTYFDTYTADKHLRFKNGELELEESISIGKIAGVYIHRNEPVWEDLSQNVYEAEWTYSRNGNYIRKNSRPTLGLFTSKEISANKAPKGDNVARDIIRLGQNDKAEYITWNAANESIKFHIDELKHNFFSQLQLPDLSMDNMKSTPMSGESRKMLFIDAQMKATDESGIWLDMLSREYNVVCAFAKVMFPSLASAIDSLQVDIEIKPYTINDEKERVEMLTAAAQKPIISQRTAVARLGYVDDIDAEMHQLADENTQDIFGGAE